MKVIDLLNKIAKGEEVPKKIEYNGEIYFRYQNHGKNNLYYYQVFGQFKFLIEQLSSVNDLLDEVEIIEENNKIEKIKWNEKSQHNIVTDNTKKTLEQLLSRTEQLKKSLNEIIDKLNERDEDV